MTYRQTLDYMFAQLPMFHRIGAAAYKANLDNTIKLCAHLGNPQDRLKCIHIAGTNGKGSVSHFIAAILQAAGYRVGLYISPHYIDFRERIKINGKYIGHRSVTQFIADNKTFIEEVKPSFFELTVGMAFQHFDREKVDFAVIETGLGGRLDSTNIIRPLLSVITNISFDHMALLGNTLPLIAAEKAGIIKPNTPVVIGEYQPDIWSVFEEKAKQTGSNIYCAEQECSISPNQSAQPGLSIFDIRLRQISTLNQVQLDNSGPYQSKNVCTAVTAIEVLNDGVEFAEGAKITADQIRAGLKNVARFTRFIGRWQYLQHAPDILCDSAHNQAGLNSLFEQLAGAEYDHIHIICGFANDKDLTGVLPLFPKKATYYFAKANVPRGLDAKLLEVAASDYGLKGKAYRSVRTALATAKRKATASDLILVTGSIFVLAEVMPKNETSDDALGTIARL
jgi:dihydrofolate synthase / folylpolyglutamate synthase